jgi:hypothetical protein
MSDNETPDFEKIILQDSDKVVRYEDFLKALDKLKNLATYLGKLLAEEKKDNFENKKLIKELRSSNKKLQKDLKILIKKN